MPIIEGEEIEVNPLRDEDYNENSKLIEEETDFGGGESSRIRHSNTTIEDEPLSQDFSQPLPQETKINEAETYIKKVYDKPDFKNIFIGKNEYDNVWVSLKGKNSKKFFISDDGIQGKPGSKLLNALGKKIVDQLEVIDTTFNDLQMQNVELKIKLEEKIEKIERQNNDLKNSLDHIERLERQNKTKEDSISDYNKEIRKLQKDLEKSSSPQERKELEKKIKEQNKHINDLQKDLEKSSSPQERKELEKKIKEKTKKIIDLQKDLEKSSSPQERKELEKHINDLEKSSSPQERKELEKKIKEQNKHINDLQKELQEYKQIKDEINEEIRELHEHIENSTDQEEKQRLEEQIEQLENRMERELTRREELFERMSLRNKVKYIFKRHGFTIFSVLTAVGTVIGVIVSNLSSGLSSVTKTVGNGLKALGKKLAQILPGMVGAIASFIFKTAGEALGFLAKNSWLLILFLVTYAIEQYSKKK